MNRCYTLNVMGTSPGSRCEVYSRKTISQKKHFSTQHITLYLDSLQVVALTKARPNRKRIRWNAVCCIIRF